MPDRRRCTAVAAGLAASLLIAASASAGAAAQEPAATSCAPGAGVVTMAGTVAESDAKTYQLFPFEVAEGTTRVEVGYSWSPTDDTTLDLGLYDADGTSGPDAFRGWGGSREGRLDKGMARAWVQADSAERAFTPGPVEPGTWNVELGIAEVAPGGASWTVELQCTDDPVGEPVAADPVDATHVANPDAGWYHGDFHMHGINSKPDAPDNAAFVQFGRDAGLDFMPVTEYVTNRHWNEWGDEQRANPDVIIWPSREVITYFGHAIVLGETPSTVEYRQGFNGITLADIQADAVADGALFGIAHPTTFPEAQFGSTCRGCEFQLSDVVDWDRVDTIEVLTDNVIFGGVQNPFTLTAIDFWESQLDAGHHITAVSGSDDKEGPDLGLSATAVYAEELSRPALIRAIKSGHAYVRTRGVAASPTLEMTATSPDGSTAMFGDTLAADTAKATVTVKGAAGQSLRIVRNGTEQTVVPIDADPFVHNFSADRTSDEGPLGTYWRVETFDAQSLTTIGNPIFLADEVPAEATTTTAAPATTVAPRSPADDTTGDDSDVGTTTDGGLFGASGLIGLAIIVALIGAALGYTTIRRRGQSG